MESHDESDQRASKRLKVDDSSAQVGGAQDASAAVVTEAQAWSEERVAVDEATKRVEPIAAKENGEKAAEVSNGDVAMTDAPAEKKTDGKTDDKKTDDRDRSRGTAPIKAE